MQCCEAGSPFSGFDSWFGAGYSLKLNNSKQMDKFSNLVAIFPLNGIARCLGEYVDSLIVEMDCLMVEN